jgi:N-acetylmuramoyl-L-alanine amidase
MDQSLFSKILILIILSPLFSCDKVSFKKPVSLLNYSGHKWLKNKKIYLDPGHGGTKATDSFRNRKDISEEDVNLNTALLLGYMLKAAGADVRYSRTRDVFVSLDDRVKDASLFKPDLFFSIHHNGTIRNMDNVNYSSLLIWGNKKSNPASYQFAKYVIKETNKLLSWRGFVVSDYAVFRESGSRILRKTANICPGVIGEIGFFTDKNHSHRLLSHAYLSREAEAYFLAISAYFKRGIPDAELLVNRRVVGGNEILLTKKKYPHLYLKLMSGIADNCILSSTVRVTINDLPVYVKRVKKNIYRVYYGKKIYAGVHRLKVSFRNCSHQYSMIFYRGFIIAPSKGDYNRLKRIGIYRIRNGFKLREGLKMLLAAHSLNAAGPDAPVMLKFICIGFKKLGYYKTAVYYKSRLHHFYPDKKRYLKRFSHSYGGSWFPVDFYGKKMNLKGNFLLCEKK